jgi:hypothetical protein
MHEESLGAEVKGDFALIFGLILALMGRYGIETSPARGKIKFQKKKSPKGSLRTD